MWCAWHVLEHGAGRRGRPPRARSLRPRAQRSQRRLLPRHLGCTSPRCASGSATGRRSRSRARRRTSAERDRALVRGAGRRRVVPRAAGELRVSTTAAHDDVGARLRAGGRRSSACPSGSSTSRPRRCGSTATRRSSGAACTRPTARPCTRRAWRSGCAARLIERGVAVHEHAHVREVRGEGAAGVASTTVGDGPRTARGARRGRRARADARRCAGGCSSGRAISSSPSRCPDVIEELGWGDEAISDARAFLHYTRTTQRRADRVRLGRRPAGARRPRCAGAIEVDPAVAAALHAHLLRWFPMLEGRAIEHAWGGPIDITPARCPAIVRCPAARSTPPPATPATASARRTSSGGSSPRSPSTGGTRLTALPIVEPPAGWIPPEPLRWAGGPRRPGRAAPRGGRRGGREAAVRRSARTVAAAPTRLGITLGR